MESNTNLKVEHYLKTNGLYFSFLKALLLSLIIASSLKLLEAQFVNVKHIFLSGLADFIRAFVFVVTSWGIGHLLLIKSDFLPKKLKLFIKKIILKLI